MMNRRLKILTAVFFSTLSLLSAVTIQAQKTQPAPERQVVIEQVRIPGPDGPQTPPPGDNFIFVASEMNFDGKVVKGAPYSAQAVTETKQTLSDGNRIINKATASVYRDSEGRTRREQTLKAIGAFGTTGEPPQTIFINDPVAGVNYALDSHTHVAHKMPPMRFEFKFAGPPDDGSGPRVNVSTPPAEFEAPTPPPFERVGPPPPPGGQAGVVFAWHGDREENSKNESLGKQTIEGVEAEGTRNTVEIPAGAIGNERPIEIVFERWYSPELQVAVMTRHSDPRFGETTYRLTNINRSEPVRSLFEVPADYKLREGMQGPGPMRMKKVKPE
jgi:hypothetical protein